MAGGRLKPQAERGPHRLEFLDRSLPPPAPSALAAASWMIASTALRSPSERLGQDEMTITRSGGNRQDFSHRGADGKSLVYLSIITGFYQASREFPAATAKKKLRRIGQAHQGLLLPLWTGMVHKEPEPVRCPSLRRRRTHQKPQRRREAGSAGPRSDHLFPGDRNPPTRFRSPSWRFVGRTWRTPKPLDPRNPIRGHKLPKPTCRTTCITPEQ